MLSLLASSSVNRGAGWLTIGEAAAYLNVSERFIRRLIAQRRVAFHHFGRHIRFCPSDLDNFAEEGRNDARP
jgi:excisionase family DNA binding protein